jgi:energy-coupling factor transport system permease protein
MTAVAGRTQPKSRRSGIGSVLLRLLPWRSAVHELWAGTKLICLTVLILVALVFPGWPAAAILTCIVLATAVAARVPLSAVPRIHPIVTITLLIGAVASFFGNGLAYYLQSLLISATLLALGILVGWTTALREVAPALVSLGAPLRRLGLPVNEWAVACALCMRTVPLLFDEFRILMAARRLRPPLEPRGAGRLGLLHDRAEELIDLLSAVLAVSIRRASELGTAMRLRGGVPELKPGPLQLRPGDVMTFTVTALGTGAIVIATIILPAGWGV